MCKQAMQDSTGQAMQESTGRQQTQAHSFSHECSSSFQAGESPGLRPQTLSSGQAYNIVFAKGKSLAWNIRVTADAFAPGLLLHARERRS